MQRLDLRTVRYDHHTQCVLFDGRKLILAVTHDALEALYNRVLSTDEAVLRASDEVVRLTRLAEIVPADDGLVTITQKRLLGDGEYDAILQNDGS